MPETALWLTTLSAFAAVMLLLVLLSGAIALLTVVFPAAAASASAAAPAAAPAGAPTGDDTPAFTAAIHAAVARALPGARVLDVHEKGASQ
jgi:hypothetical protein